MPSLRHQLLARRIYRRFPEMVANIQLTLAFVIENCPSHPLYGG